MRRLYTICPLEVEYGEADKHVERISAVTLRASDMAHAVHFYNTVLGLDILYGGRDACFSSLRTEDAKGVILNLEQGPSRDGWGRIIFYERISIGRA